MLEAGVFQDIVNLDYKINSPKSGKETSIYDLVGSNEIGYDLIVINDEIERLLKVLNAKQKEVIVLYYLEGYTQVEISKMYGCSQSNIKRIIHESIDLIRRRFLPKKCCRNGYHIDETIKKYIIENYTPRSTNFGARALSVQFGLHENTILRIVREHKRND